VPKNKYILLFSVFSGLLILTRGEFFLILITIILLAIYKKNIKINNLIKVILIIFITVSPYLIRNYNTFNEIVIVKSLGYNLWKGNNEYSPVEGYENYKSPKLYNFKIELDKLEKNKNYEISRDNFFLDKAKTNLIKDPSRYISLFFKKLFSFYFIDLNSSYKNYYHYLHFFPILLISILSVPGFLILLKKNKYRINYLELYLLSNLFLFSVFFILPRYKLIIIPIQIIFVGFLIQYLFNKFYKKKLKDE
jgi:hypothetical protein